jgi:hypothetical protein
MDKKDFIKNPFNASRDETLKFYRELKAKNDKNEPKFIRSLLTKIEEKTDTDIDSLLVLSTVYKLIKNQVITVNESFYSKMVEDNIEVSYDVKIVYPEMFIDSLGIKDKLLHLPTFDENKIFDTIKTAINERDQTKHIDGIEFFKSF